MRCMAITFKLAKDKPIKHLFIMFRRQTLKNAERYIIPELKEYEDKVLKSKGAALALEKQLYDELFDLLLPHLGQLQLASFSIV